jgi:hypothetical protein
LAVDSPQDASPEPQVPPVSVARKYVNPFTRTRERRPKIITSRNGGGQKNDAVNGPWRERFSGGENDCRPRTVTEEANALAGARAVQRKDLSRESLPGLPSMGVIELVGEDSAIPV